MPKPEKEVREDTDEYEAVQLGLRINKNGAPMFAADEMRWPNCPYAMGVALQYHEWRKLGIFLNAGIAEAVEKGQEDILRVLRVPVEGVIIPQEEMQLGMRTVGVRIPGDGLEPKG